MKEKEYELLLKLKRILTTEDGILDEKMFRRILGSIPPADFRNEGVFSLSLLSAAPPVVTLSHFPFV